MSRLYDVHKTRGKYDLNVINAQLCAQAVMTFLDMPLLGDQN